MVKFKDKSFWNTVSLLLFCSYPAIPSMKGRALVVGLFLVIQFLIFFVKKKFFSEKWFLVLMVSPFLIYILSLLYTNNLSEGLKSLERIITIFIAPLALYLNKELINKSSTKLTLSLFSFSSIVLVTYTLISLLYNNINPFNSNYYDIRTALENYSGMHPTYFSLTISIGFLYLLSTFCKGAKIKTSILLICGACLLLIGLLIASSKMILIANLLASIIIILERIPKKKVILISILGGIVITTAVISITPLKNRFSEFFNAITNTSIQTKTPDGMRKVIYKGDFYAIKNKPLMGSGLGSQQELLDQFYQNNNYKQAYKTHYNAHNQYLQSWITAGVIPFILLIIANLSIITIGILNKNRLVTAIGVLLSLSMLTESILARQDGIFIFAFFPSFLVYGIWNQLETKIFINGRFLTQTITGVQRYATEIANILLQKKQAFNLISNTGIKNSFRLAFLNGNLWEQITLPIYLKLIGSPLLINLCNSAPILYHNHITTIHDVAFLEKNNWFTPKFKKWYSFMMRFTTNNARKIITVSEFSKNEIATHYKIVCDKIEITYNGASEKLIGIKHESPIIDQPYILTVGTVSERKQQLKLIETFLHYGDISEKLVIAGSKNELIFGLNNGLTDKINQSERIIFIEDPTDSILSNLYKNSKFSIYISIYEGFGLPILESLLFCKPVIVSEIPVFRELFNGHVCFSKSNDIHDLYKSIFELNKNLSFWTQKATNFKENNPYSFTLSAEKLVQFTEEINSTY